MLLHRFLQPLLVATCAGGERMSDIIWISLLSGLTTSLGGLIVTLFGKPKDRWLALLLGMAAGIMLAVVIFDLLPASLLYGGPPTMVLGFLLGSLILWMLDFILTRVYPQSGNAHHRIRYFRKLGYLIAIGIALHDLPEGIAIAVGFETNKNLGMVIALAVALHNIPEGMATAAPLKIGQVRRRNIMLISCLVSLFTPLGTGIGLMLMEQSKNSISLLLALAAGAMAYIVKDELLPALKSDHLLVSRFGLVLGFGLILFLTLASL
jgi:ZIP family zinc transporter